MSQKHLKGMIYNYFKNVDHNIYFNRIYVILSYKQAGVAHLQCFSSPLIIHNTFLMKIEKKRNKVQSIISNNSWLIHEKYTLNYI